jgi:hypothetical protein
MICGSDLGAQGRLADLPGAGDEHYTCIAQRIDDDWAYTSREQRRRHVRTSRADGCLGLRKWLIG